MVGTDPEDQHRDDLVTNQSWGECKIDVIFPVRRKEVKNRVLYNYCSKLICTFTLNIVVLVQVCTIYSSTSSTYEHHPHIEKISIE